jgi:hypothetical protein
VAGSIAVGLALLVTFFIVESRGDRKWRELETSFQRLAREASGRSHLRAVPAGVTPIPGNAWDDYGQAEAEVSLIVSERPFIDFVDYEHDSPELRASVQARAAALDFLHKGARRSDGRYPYRWEQFNEQPTIRGDRSMLALLASAKSRILMEQGRGAEAAGIVGDLLTYAQDSGRNTTLFPTAVALSVYSRAIKEAELIVASGNLSREEIRQFAARLEALDRDFPAFGPSVLNEAVRFGALALQSDGSLTALSNYQRGWDRRLLVTAAEGAKQGFSGKAAWADIFVTLETYVRAVEKLDSADDFTAVREAQRLDASRSSDDPARAVVPISFVQMYLPQHRGALARLRVVRAAAEYRVSGIVPELADPLGGNVLHKIEKDRLKIWSVGTDGKNDSGKASSPNNPEDIVLELAPSTEFGERPRILDRDWSPK